MIFDVSGMLELLQMQSYVIVFLLMILEGPIVTAIAAFAASFGLMNIWIILFLSIIGKLIPDVLLYLIGRFGRTGPVERFVNKLGISKSKIKNLERRLREHAGKSIVFVKLVPPFPVPGIILAGFAKVPFKKFFIISLVFNIIASVIFAILGYYFGFAMNSILKYYNMLDYIFVFLAIFAIILYIVYKKFLKKLAVKWEGI